MNDARRRQIMTGSGMVFAQHEMRCAQRIGHAAFSQEKPANCVSNGFSESGEDSDTIQKMDLELARCLATCAIADLPIAPEHIRARRAAGILRQGGICIDRGHRTVS